MDWDSNHEAWIDQIKGLMDDDIREQLDDDDLMFISNLAAEVMHGRISLPGVLMEIHKWVNAKSGMVYMHDEETFELEMRVNHPDLIEVTSDVKHNLITAGEPGIADGIIKIWAHPAFTEFVAETSTVAMTGKRWFNIEGLRPDEHLTLGWAIAQAARDAR